MFPTYGLLDSTDRVANLKLDHLRRQWTQRGPTRWLHRAYLAFVLLVASLPFFIPIDDHSSFILIFMAVIIGFAQLALIARTVAQGMEETATERITGSWDVLVMTGVNARQIVRGKWWVVVQKFWPEWVFMTVARLGLVYGVAQYLEFGSAFTCRALLPDTVCYESLLRFIYPTLTQAFFQFANALCIIILLTFAGLCFSSALGICAGLLPTKNRMAMWVGATVVLLVLIGSAIITMPAFETIDHWSRNENYCIQGSACYQFFHSGSEKTADDYNREIAYRHTMLDIGQFSKAIQLSGFTLADGGILLTASDLAPRDHYLLRSLYNFVPAVLSILVFKFLTWLVLRIAQAFAIRHGALPPPTRAEFRRQFR